MNTATPFEFVDMSVKEPYKDDWRERVRTRIRRSDGVIVLVSKNSLVVAAILIWMAAVTSTFLLLDAPTGLVLAAERQYPALAAVRAALTSLVYRKYVY